MRCRSFALSAALLGAISIVPAASSGAPLPGLSAGGAAEEDGDASIRWWYRQRAYPAGTIPATAHADGLAAYQALRKSLPGSAPAWKLIGPAPLVTSAGANPPSPNAGPVSGRIAAIAVDPTNASTLFAGGVGGVWRSTDRGKSWAVTSDAQPSIAIAAIAIDPKAPATIYAGTGSADLSASYAGQGILKSTDGGKSWIAIAADRFASVSVNRIVVDPVSGEIYAGTQRGVAGQGGACTEANAPAMGEGLFRSSDGGSTWSQLHAGAILDLEIDASVTPRRIYIDEWLTGVHRSLDGGATWEIAAGLPAGAGRAEIAVAPSNPAILYAGVDRIDHGEVYLSTDFGKSFAPLSGAPDHCGQQCAHANAVAVAPDDPATVYLGGSACGVFRIANALGASPAVQAISIPGGDCGPNGENAPLGAVHGGVRAFAFEIMKPGVIYAGGDGGLARTEDKGQHWDRLNDGLASMAIRAVCADPNDPTITIAGAEDSGAMIRAADGTSWNGLTRGDGVGCAIDAGDSARVAIAGPGGAIFVSADRFATAPEQVFAVDPPCDGMAGCGDRVGFVPPLVADPTQPGTFYVGTHRLWRSTEGGAAGTWSPISEDLTAGGKSVQCAGDMVSAEDDTISAVTPATTDAKVIYTGSAAGVLSVTFDGGATWARIDKAPLPRRAITGIAVDPLDARTVYVSFSGFNAATPDAKGHVFRSFDGGARWESGDIGMDVPVNALIGHPTIEGILYAATDFGVIATNDGGGTWSALGKGLPNVAVSSLSFRRSPASLVAGTEGRSAWELSFSPRLVINPTEVFLHAQEGDESVTTTLEAVNPEGFGSTLRVSITTETDWIAPTPQKAWAGGSITGGVNIRAWTTGKAPGAYDGSVIVSIDSADGPSVQSFAVPVHLTIAPRVSAPSADIPPAGLIAGGGCAFRTAGFMTDAQGAPAVIAAAALGSMALRRRRRSFAGATRSRCGKVPPR